MEFDQKVKYALIAMNIASVVLAGIGLHMGVHIKALEGGGNADSF
jgi:hypothetical protein